MLINIIFYPLTAIRDNSRAVKHGPPLLSTTCLVPLAIVYNPGTSFIAKAFYKSNFDWSTEVSLGLFLEFSIKNNKKSIMKGQICKFRKWNESKMVDVNWSEDDTVLGLFADNSYEEADFMGFLPQDMKQYFLKYLYLTLYLSTIRFTVRYIDIEARWTRHENSHLPKWRN